MPVASVTGTRILRACRGISRSAVRALSAYELPLSAAQSAGGAKRTQRFRAALPALCRVLALFGVLFLGAVLVSFVSREPSSATSARPLFEGSDQQPIDPGYEGRTSYASAMGGEAAVFGPETGCRVVLVIPPITNKPPPSNPSLTLPPEFEVAPEARVYSLRALQLLLGSLLDAFYDNERVTLQLVLAPEANRTAFEERYMLCNEIAWTHGPKLVHNATTGGLYELGVGAWSPPRGDTQKVLIVDASRSSPLAPQYYRYLKSVRRRYLHSAADIAGFALEPVLVRYQSSLLGSVLGYKSEAILPKKGEDEVFLYHNLPLVSAFSPIDAEVWRTFQRWFAAHRSEWFLWPTVIGAKDKNDPSWSEYHGTARAHWTLWFSRFCAEYDMYSVYPRRHRPEPLPPLGRASASAPLTRFNFQGKPVAEKPGIQGANLERIIDLGIRQGGSISMTVVNEAFLETAHSWICNVDTAGIRPPGVVWIATDDVSYESLRKVRGTETIRMTEFRGGQAHTGTSYGTPGYWLLMLERSHLIRAILERGIGVFAFETDQVWLRNPVPFVERLVHSGDEVDLVGTLDTRHEIGGNFLFFNPTLATRRLWREVCRRFEKAYYAHRMDRHTAKYNRYMENDQSTMTKLVFFDEAFKAKNPVVFRALDTDQFVDGRWYDQDRKFYSAARAQSPIMINNNFLVGIDKKQKRAQAHGHWFRKSGVCDDGAVRRAIDTNNARANATAEGVAGMDIEAGLDAALRGVAREREQGD